MAISGRYLAYVRSMYDVRVEEETNNIMFFSGTVAQYPLLVL